MLECDGPRSMNKERISNLCAWEWVCVWERELERETERGRLPSPLVWQLSSVLLPPLNWVPHCLPVRTLTPGMQLTSLAVSFSLLPPVQQLLVWNNRVRISGSMRQGNNCWNWIFCPILMIMEIFTTLAKNYSSEYAKLAGKYLLSGEIFQLYSISYLFFTNSLSSRFKDLFCDVLRVCLLPWWSLYHLPAVLWSTSIVVSRASPFKSSW